ncbi:MAG: hypothetical protein IKA12_03475 [Clostridia bacterium]|nr:hypothetical protein [Clostridia bacterium]
MKKLIVNFLTVMMLITTMCSVTACTACANGDRYELTLISGLGISTDAYDYNYIDFNFSNNTYTLKNKAKANGIVSKQTGTFIEDRFGGVTLTNDEIPSQDYILYYNETLLFSDDYSKFYASAKINGVEILMIFTKK